MKKDETKENKDNDIYTKELIYINELLSKISDEIKAISEERTNCYKEIMVLRAELYSLKSEGELTAIKFNDMPSEFNDMCIRYIDQDIYCTKLDYKKEAFEECKELLFSILDEEYDDDWAID